MVDLKYDENFHNNINYESQRVIKNSCVWSIILQFLQKSPNNANKSKSQFQLPGRRVRRPHGPPLNIPKKILIQ